MGLRGAPAAREAEWWDISICPISPTINFYPLIAGVSNWTDVLKKNLDILQNRSRT